MCLFNIRFWLAYEIAGFIMPRHTYTPSIFAYPSNFISSLQTMVPLLFSFHICMFVLMSAYSLHVEENIHYFTSSSTLPSTVPHLLSLFLSFYNHPVLYITYVFTYRFCIWQEKVVFVSLDLVYFTWHADLSRGIHFPENDMTLFFSVTKNNSIVLMYHIFSIHFFIDVHPGWFHILSVIKSTAVNIPYMTFGRHIFLG